MSKRNKPKKQHIVPVTYLKQFHTGDGKSVYCFDFSDPQRQYVQKIHFGDKKFKIKNFYTDVRLENRYAIEEFFAKNVEPLYPGIIKAVNEESQLSNDEKGGIIVWIFTSNLRKVTSRLNYERISKWLFETMSKYKKEEIDHDHLARRSQKIAKEAQLNPFSDPEQSKELMLLFERTLALKQWRILKTTNNNPFWTNDSPVFSPNVHPMFQKDVPYHAGAELNANSWVYFVLSPLYCLEISPFVVGTPLDATLWNMSVPYENAFPNEIEFINMGVFYTRHKMVISNNKQSLELRIKRKPS